MPETATKNRVNSAAQLEKLLANQRDFDSVIFENFEWQDDSEALKFVQCEFEDIVFRGSKILECEFTECEFDSCGFDSAKIGDCIFHKCKFYNNEKEAGCSFKFARFPGTTFTHSDLSLCNFSRADLYRIEMDQCQATGMDCSYATNAQSIGTAVTLNAARLSDCNFSYADFTGAFLCDAELPNNRFSHAVFNNANLENAVLTDCDLHGIQARDVTLKGADIRGAMISGLDVRVIDMTGVRVSDYQQRVLLEAIGIIID